MQKVMCLLCTRVEWEGVRLGECVRLEIDLRVTYMFLLTVTMILNTNHISDALFNIPKENLNLLFS